MVIGKS